MSTFDEAALLALEEQRRSPSALAKHQKLLELLCPLPGEHIVDLGCGSGALSRLLAARVAPGGRVLGIDTSVAAVDLARRLADAPAGQLSFEQGDGHVLSLPDGAFDAATCVSVLAFCADPARVLSELCRVLRPGGRLLVVSSDEDTRIYNSHDHDLGRRVLRAMADRALHPWIGRRLLGLLGRVGFRITHEVVSTTVERDFVSNASGYIFAHAWRDIVLAGGVAEEEYERWLVDLSASADAGCYCYSVTTFAYLAERPDSGVRRRPPGLYLA